MHIRRGTWHVHIPEYVHVPREQTYLFCFTHQFDKFRGFLEAASESTNVPGSSEHAWTPFHLPPLT